MRGIERKPSAAVTAASVPLSAAALVRLLLVGAFLFALSGQAPLLVSAAVNPRPRQVSPIFKKRGAPPTPRAPSALNAPAPPPVPGSVVFPLTGNVYPTGIYYAEVSVGNPPKPYFLDIDTGSDVTWLQCDAPCIKCSKAAHPLYKPAAPLSCQNPICTSLHSGGGGSPVPPAGCSGAAGPSGRCTYSIQYADNGLSQGYLVSDSVSLRFTTNGTVSVPGVVLGCGYDQQGGTVVTQPTDGVLGLGQGKSGILAQLRDRGAIRNMVGHCLGSKGGGFLFLGDGLVPPSGMTWAPMSSRGARSSNGYSPGPGALLLGRQPLVSRGFQAVFDSGSSYTYFASSTYGSFLAALMKDLSGKPLKQAPEDRTLPVCWKGPKPFRSVADVKGYFSSSMVLGFPGGAGSRPAGMNIPPEGYLIVTTAGNVCLGILNGTQAGLGDLNVIGDMSMQDQLIVYDNEKAQIGWARTNCDRSVKPTRLNL